MLTPFTPKKTINTKPLSANIALADAQPDAPHWLTGILPLTKSKEDEKDELWTLEQAAEYLKIHRTTLYRWRRTEPGFPPDIEIGPRSVRISRNGLFAWVATRNARRSRQSA